MVRSLKSLMVVTLLVPLFLLAGEEEERIPVGSRPPASAPVSQGDEGEEGDEQAVAGFIFDQYPHSEYPPVYFPASHHWTVAVAADGDSLETHNGSVWKVSQYDRKKILNWRTDEPIVITQNHRWFTSHKYRIINKTTGDSVEASLHLSPIKNGQFTYYVASVDAYNRLVTIQDAQNNYTHWKVYSSDAYKLYQWAPTDMVIHGINTSWYSSHYDYLLINVNMNDFIRVQQY